MEKIQKDFIKIKNSTNPEEINDFLIKLSKNPDKESLQFIDYFIESSNLPVFEKIKLNIIFIIGEIGKLSVIEHKYIKFIMNSYYNSDRWIRNEIFQAIDKISRNIKLSEEIVMLILNAISDEYIPIKKKALEILLNLKRIPDFKNIFYILNSENSELVVKGLKIIFKFFPSSNEIFNSLNSFEYYKFLNKNAIRSLLMIFSESIIDVKSFRELIENSSWENKNDFLQEIKIYEQILLKKNII